MTDSFGRAWRQGQCDVAIGCAGLAPLVDWRGRPTAAGRELAATWVALADEVAAAADLARDKTSAEPVVIVGGLGRHVSTGDGPGAAALVRPRGRRPLPLTAAAVSRRRRPAAGRRRDGRGRVARSGRRRR